MEHYSIMLGTCSPLHMHSLLNNRDGGFLPQSYETGAKVAFNSRRAVGQTAFPEIPSTSHDSHLGWPEESSLPFKNFVSGIYSHDQTLHQC